MTYDVLVVGAGIGGLSVAALLSARGMSVSLLERQSQAGGCIARVEFSGHQFEPGMGLYTSLGPGEIYEKLFAQLPIDLPPVSPLTSAYVIRSSNGDVKTSRDDLYSLAGGVASLAESLAESIKLSGGSVRLNSPVLRLSYDESGHATGVDLLSGERVLAARAIISNLTVWDTYGKLVGLSRTPLEIKKQMSLLHGTGVYVIYASMEEQAVARLPSERLLVKDSSGEFTMAVAAEQTAPPGKRSVTFTTRCEVEPWFAYQSSEEDYEEWDREALEEFWTRLHAALPELGGDIEIIETANPRTYYDQTRRKLGMVLGVEGSQSSSHTFLPNVFMVGDTVSAGASVDEVVRSSVSLANRLTGFHD